MIVRPWLYGLLALGAAACRGRGGYDVTVRVPGDVAEAARLQVDVVASCGEIAALGDDPDAPLRTVSAPDGAPIGNLPAGRYGLYGRAWRDDCTLYAAACVPFEVDGGGEGHLEIFLASIPERACPPEQLCVEGRCEGAGDAGAPDGGTGWRLWDRDDADFDQGELGSSTVVTEGFVRLAESAESGEYTSRTLTAPTDLAMVQSLRWVPRAPAGKELPPADAGDAELAAYAQGGIDVSDLVLLQHFDVTPGTRFGDGRAVTDSSGHGHDAVMVDLAGVEDSESQDGRIGPSLFLQRDDYLRIPDAATHPDFAFDTGEFTWAAWVRIEGCEPSEDNVIALGGELPHVWLGALCPEGVAWWEVHDDAGAGGGIGSEQTIVDGRWHHLVGVKVRSHSERTVLYVDGELADSRTESYGTFGNFTKELLIGNFPIGDPPEYTYRSELAVDELAVFRRGLSSEDVQALYQRGATRLGLQVRGCPATGCDGVPYMGPDGTDLTLFSELGNSTADLPPAIQSIPARGTIFQYRATFETDVLGTSAALDEVELIVGPE